MITEWLTDIDTSDPREVLVARALHNSPIKDLVSYASHLEEVHENLHRSANLFGVDPDPDTCDKVQERLDQIDDYIDKVLDAQMN